MLGPEWDSSDEEGVTTAPSMSKDKKSKQKSSSKVEKKRQAKDSAKAMTKHQPKQDDSADDDEDLVLYIGHLPKEFEEKDLIKFLSQFGKVYNCRIARKIQTGNPKGYAFARFGDVEVAKIVCETLHGYFLGRQRLVCQLRPAHPGMFFNTDSVIAKRRLEKRVAKQQRSQDLANADKLKQITSKLVSREQKKRKQLKAMGIDFDFPGYETNQAEYEVQFVDDNKVDASSRKRSDSASSEGSTKKKARKDSIDSVGSGKKKKKRKNSVGSLDDEVEQKRERAASVDSESGEKKKLKKRRKDSIGSEGSTKKKRKSSDASNASLEETPEKSKTRQPETAVKKAKKKKDKKRRQSAP